VLNKSFGFIPKFSTIIINNTYFATTFPSKKGYKNMNGFHAFEAFLGIKLYCKIYKHCVQKKDTSSDLKVLSIEMDLAVSIVSSDISLLKRETRIFLANSHLLILWVRVHQRYCATSHNVGNYRNAIANSGQKTHCAIRKVKTWY
jgi:hypothetical protein